MPIRVLCLGNDLMADDGVGPAVALRLRELNLPNVEVFETAESGFRLLDYLATPRLIVIDAITSGGAVPGTIYALEPRQFRSAPGTSPHYAGLQEALLLGQALGLAVAPQVTILAVEAADCTSIGGPMHDAVQGAIERVVDFIRREAVSLPAQPYATEEGAT
jgi:hydrogenase maturation protease